METFSDWIERQLKERNWRPADLARAAGITDAALSRILSGTRNPGPDVCQAIAQALNEPPEKVFRLAGLLPPLPPGDGDVEEITEIARRLAPDRRKQALDFLRYLFKKRD